MSNLLRWGGLAGLVAAVTFTLSALINVVALQEEQFTSTTDYIIEIAFAIALSATVAVIAALHVLQRDRYGRAGAAGALVTGGGYALLAIAATATAIAAGETFDDVFTVGILAMFVGSLLLGIATVRAHLLPAWCGWLIAIGFPLSIVLDVTVTGAGTIILGAVWGLIGYALLRRCDETEKRLAMAM